MLRHHERAARRRWPPVAIPVQVTERAASDCKLCDWASFLFSLAAASVWTGEDELESVADAAPHSRELLLPVLVDLLVVLDSDWN